MQRAPVARPPLQRPPDAVPVSGHGAGSGKASGSVIWRWREPRHRLDGGVALEDRQQQRLPHRLERIGNGAPALWLALGRQAGIGVDPARGALGSNPARAAAARWL
jgi:hypothetical protein